MHSVPPAKIRLLLLLVVALMPSVAPAQVDSRIDVPAATAYLEPDESAARVSPQGITRWTNPEVQIKWYGQVNQPGELSASVLIKPTSDGDLRFRLSVGDQTREASVAGNNAEPTMVEFGSFAIDKVGYHSFVLARLDEDPACDVQSLSLEGPAIKKSHFNMKPRRNAASVHLFYPISSDENVTAFYCEMTGVEDPLWTYYMACGWHRGYFGMQVNSPTERRIIFSVWDSGNEAVDRKKVVDVNRVKLVAKGDGVNSGSFGNEGTGGHSHLKFAWKTGEKQRFLVTAEPLDATHTVFAGYYFRPDIKKWMLISSWNAPKEGKYLRGLYSFSENFVGRNGHLLRKALYDNQWIRTSEGEWIELTGAKFSHDPTGKSDRLDRWMGVQDGQFFLSHGGFMDDFTSYGKQYSRPKTNRSPANMDLPQLPPIVDRTRQ